MSTEARETSGSSFMGANVEPGIRVEATSAPTLPVQQTVPMKRAQARRAQQEAPKPLEVKRTVPEGAIIPTMGWPRFHYRLNCLMRHPERVPSLSSKELSVRAELEAERQANLNREDKKNWLSEFSNSSSVKAVDTHTGEISELEWEAQPTVIAVLTQKGGAGKTEVAVQLSRVYSKMIEPAVTPILIIPATRNPGSTTRKSGVVGEDTLTLPELEALLKRLEEEANQAKEHDSYPTRGNVAYISAKSVTSRLRKNADGVYVVAQSQLPPDFDAKRYQWVLERLKKIFPLIIQDTGNNTAKEGEIEYMAAQMADVLVFVCFTEMDGSPDLMGLTMDSYSILRNKEKLSSSITVVNGLRPDDSLENWARFAEYKINEHGHTVGIRDFPYRVSTRDGVQQTGTLLAIPWDDAIARHNGEPIDQKAADAYLELAYQIALTKGRLGGLDFGRLDRIRSIKKMVAEFDPSLLSEQYPTPQAWIAAHQRGEIPTN